MQNMYEIALNDGQNEINTHTKWDIWYIFIVFLRAIIQEYSPETEDFFFVRGRWPTTKKTKSEVEAAILFV